jgi:hypothetical protein
MAQRKFISYLRVSTDKQGRSGLGIEAQREAVTSYLNGGRWTLVAEYVETESGRRSDRPKLAAALSSHAKAVGAKLVFAKLDRLTRNVDLLRSLVHTRHKPAATTAGMCCGGYPPPYSCYCCCCGGSLLRRRATAVGCHVFPRGAFMPCPFNSLAMPRTVVIPEPLMVAMIPWRLSARCAAFCWILVTASALPVCLPRRARAPLGFPSFTPRALASARAFLVRS